MNNPYIVRPIYIIPTDKVDGGTEAIKDSVWHVREFYRQQLGNGKVFSIAPVATFYSTHDSAWYGTHNRVPDIWVNWFSGNVKDDLLSFVGYDAYWDVHNDWIMYVDAAPDIIDGVQQTAGGSINRVVEWSKPLAAIRGLDPDWTICRALGGLGHEMGHSFGLSHPPAQPVADWEASIMGTGYLIYPTCKLLDTDAAPQKTICNANPLFALPYYASPKISTDGPQFKDSMCPFP